MRLLVSMLAAVAAWGGVAMAQRIGNVPVRRVNDAVPAAVNEVRFEPMLTVTQGLTLHLAADRIAALNDGDRVALWEDLSGIGNNAAQATDAKRPIFRTGVLNGKPIVRFDGVLNNPRYLSIDSFGINIRSATTVLVGQSHDNNGIFFSQRSNNGRWYPYRHRFLCGTGAVIDYSTAFTGHHVFINMGDLDLKRAYVDGIDQGTVTNTDTTQPTRVHIGCGTNANQTPADGAGWGELNGEIAEILVYNRPLSEDERKAVETYLGQKWLNW